MKFLAVLEFINRVFSLIESYLKRKTLEQRELDRKEIDNDPKAFFNRGNQKDVDVRAVKSDDQRM